jgi:hypothetical protein
MATRFRRDPFVQAMARLRNLSDDGNVDGRSSRQEIDMHMDGAFLTPETVSFVRVQEALQTLGLPSETATTLLATFIVVWRDAVDELKVAKPEDCQRLCAMAADAVIAFAKAGLEPEQIRRFARSNLLFMATRREAAAAM